MGWLSIQKHNENNDEEIASMTQSINVIKVTIHIPACMTIQDIQKAILNDIYLQELKAYIKEGYLLSGTDEKQDMHPF